MTGTWRNATLMDLVTLQRGHDITKAQQRPGPYPVVSSSGVSSYHDDFKAEGPGVVIGRKGSLGTVFYLSGPYWPHDTTLWVTDFHGNDPKYSYYFLNTMRLEQFDVGAANPTLNRNHIHGLPVRFPDVATQHRIADILSAYDDLIENNTKRIKILEEMARSLYREWFVNFRFPGHEKVKMVSSPLGKVPEGWGIARLGELVDDVRDGVQPTELDPDTPYFGLEHLPRRSLALTEWGCAADVQSTKLRIQPLDILFGKIRPYFHKVGPSPVAGVCSSDTIVLRVRPGRSYGAVLSVVSSDDFVRHATQTSQGTKMPRANWDVLQQYPVPIAPAALQGRFDAVIADSVALLHALVFKNRALANTRDLLLPRLISGELSVDAVESP